MSEPTSEQWLDLHQAFRDYCESKPWEWMDDTDLVAVEHPFGEYKGYCVVLGGGGIEYGLAVYNGDEGLAGYLEAVSGDMDEDTPEFLDTMNALSAQLANREHLTKADRDTIRSLGLRYRGPRPFFPSTKPGYAPWRLDADEAVFLTMALRNIIDVAARVAGGELDLYGDDDYSRTLTRAFDNGVWQDRWDPFVLPTPPPVPDYPYPERLRQLAESKPRQEDVWEFGFFFIYAPVQMEKGERPFFPLAAFLCDRNSTIALPEQFFEPGPTAADQQELLVKLLEIPPILPSEIAVNNVRAAHLIEPVTSSLSIQLSVGDTGQLYEIKQMMAEFF